MDRSLVLERGTPGALRLASAGARRAEEPGGGRPARLDRSVLLCCRDAHAPVNDRPSGEETIALVGAVGPAASLHRAHDPVRSGCDPCPIRGCLRRALLPRAPS